MSPSTREKTFYVERALVWPTCFDWLVLICAGTHFRFGTIFWTRKTPSDEVVGANGWKVQFNVDLAFKRSYNWGTLFNELPGFRTGGSGYVTFDQDEYRTGEEWFDNPALVEDYTSNWYIRFPAGLRLSNNELPLWGRTVERDPFNNGLSGQCSNLIGVTPDATTSNNFEECNGPRFGLPFSDVPQVQYLGRGFDYVLSHNGPQCTETCPGDTDGDGIMNDNDDPQKDAPCPCYVTGY